MATFGYDLDQDGTAICGLLYHPQRPCANPGNGQDEQIEGERR
jgi:hypothetical protein